MKKCSKCTKIKEFTEFNTRPDRLSGYRSECKKCQYATHHKRHLRNPQQTKVKEQAAYAYRQGKIKRPKCCEKCGEIRPLDRHHFDYEYPLWIIWVCRPCHGKLTAQKCLVLGCQAKHHAKGLCVKHYWRLRRSKLLTSSSSSSRAGLRVPGPAN